MKFRVYSKVGVIILVALLLVVPLGMISTVVYDRNVYRDQVISDIERTWTGAQRIAGPVLSVPYWIDVVEPFINKTTGLEEKRTRRYKRTLYRVADTLAVTSNAETETRSRGIYSVPVYLSSHRLTGLFDVSGLQEIIDQPGFVRFDSFKLSLIVSDIRGIGGNPTLLWNGVKHSFNAGSAVPNLGAGVHAQINIPKNATQIPVDVTIELRGSQELSFVPLANELTAQLDSTWPHPKFDGQFLPAKREISEQGFVSSWSMSSFATNAQRKLNNCASDGDCYPLEQLAFGVKFFEPIDIYVKVSRAIKYGALFIVLTFVAFFLTETLTRSRLHPMQYALVGLALAVFYLLLVSLSEHLSFGLAYSMATFACVALIGTYLTGALNQGRLAAVFSAGIGLLYAMLFLILRSEDFALLMGALLVFVMLATVMLLTRQIDWYEISGKPSELKIDDNQERQ